MRFSIRNYGDEEIQIDWTELVEPDPDEEGVVGPPVSTAMTAVLIPNGEVTVTCESLDGVAAVAPPAPEAPVLTAIEGVTGDNDAPADGVSKNTVVFNAVDQDGNAMPGQVLTISTDGSASADTSVTTDGAGSAVVNVTDTVAETVTVTADGGGGVTGTATSTFS